MEKPLDDRLPAKKPSNVFFSVIPLRLIGEDKQSLHFPSLCSNFPIRGRKQVLQTAEDKIIFLRLDQ